MVKARRTRPTTLRPRRTLWQRPGPAPSVSQGTFAWRASIATFEALAASREPILGRFLLGVSSEEGGAPTIVVDPFKAVARIVAKALLFRR